MRAALRDIAHHIDLAAHFTAGFDHEAFVADPSTVYAAPRCLEIISEASRRLPDDLKAPHPSIAWRDMAGAGNIYRHDYEDVAAQHVWDHGADRLAASACSDRSRVGHARSAADWIEDMNDKTPEETEAEKRRYSRFMRRSGNLCSNVEETAN